MGTNTIKLVVAEGAVLKEKGSDTPDWMKVDQQQAGEGCSGERSMLPEGWEEDSQHGAGL